MHAHHQLPPAEVVEQAISVLLGGFPGRSGHPDGLETNATEDALESEIAELELSASVIQHELLLRATQLKRRLNSSQWIYQLPEEVFADILVTDVLSFGLEEEEHRGTTIYGAGHPRPSIATPAARRTRLCNVSHRFLQTVMSTPRIWSDIRWRRDDYLRLLQRSGQAPLMIRCREFDPIILKTPGTMEEFLKAVWEHSQRWKALSLDLQLDESRLPSTEFPAPQLRDLDITNHHYRSLNLTPHIFKISGNPSLENLTLTETSLQWDGIDFSRLKSLSLRSVRQGAPSLEQLVETLRMASGLEQLSLRQVNTVSSKAQQLESQPAHLNALITLSIHDMPSGSADYIITRIRSPRLKICDVHGLLLKHFENPSSDQNPYHHFFRVIRTILSSRRFENLVLSNEIFSKAVCLRPELRWSHQAVGSVDFEVETENPVRGVEAMVEFLTSYCMDYYLIVMASGFVLPPPSSESYFPAEVLGKLPMVTRISAGMLVDAVNILNFLGSPQRDEGTGRLGWACPQLQVLAMEGTEGLTPDHIQTFLDARDANWYTLEREIAELELSASSLHHELLLRAARLKRRHNSSQWTYRLPEEVFAGILVTDVLGFGLEEEERQGTTVYVGQLGPSIQLPAVRRAQLCNVSHRFLQTVMTTPRIWSDIRWRRDDHLRLLRMSAQAPLMIRCWEMDPIILKTPGTMEEFLKAVWEHSERWKALSLDLHLDESRLPSPEFLAPQLRELKIINRRYLSGAPLDFAPYVFKISGNPSLRKLDLTETSLQWDGIDFSRLKSLSLSSIQQRASSLENLAEILTIASCLESLLLSQVNTVNLDTWPRLESQPIRLNALLTLLIDQMPRRSVDYLITRIRSPRLKIGHVHGLLLKHFENPSSDQNPYHHFFRVITPILSSRRFENLVLCNEILLKVVCLRPEFIWSNQPAFATGSANFGVETENPVRGVEAMVEFLTSYCIDCSLVVMASGRYLPPPSSQSYFPAEVLGKLPMVTRISAGILVDAVNILNILGSPRRIEGTGRFEWACPQLEVLAVEGTEGLTPDHIQTFLDARYGDGNPLIIEGQVVQRPRRVEFQHHGLIS
ncbi:hypothetical protein FS837_011857 [Tulasnella sp. UAMH 9824]|nr:hypothetical protein FS837_011857 [Tulasnella sp. UAMH 9824]